MSEHQGSSFVDSCVKVPVDPYSRQPTPSYERPRLDRIQKQGSSVKGRKINFAGRNASAEKDSSPGGSLENLLEFLDSIPDYDEIHHLSNEQFKRKLDYLKRKQRLLLKNLRNCLDEAETLNGNKNVAVDLRPANRTQLDSNKTNVKHRLPEADLKLSGKKCSLEDSRVDSPLLFSTGTFAGLAQDQDLLTYRCKDKEKAMKTMRNREIHSAGKSWSTWSDSKTESVESGSESSAETRSLPPNSPKRWHPTVPKPFRFAVRDEAEKYMSVTEMEAEGRSLRDVDKSKCSYPKKRRFRPIPLTSRIPLYDKLMAAKEERSRMIREESAWSLMAQVKPFRLECERRAGKAISRSSPELCSRSARSTSRFRAKPVPKNLFGTQVYDRMLEDEYYRQLQKKVRAAELLKSASLPPSMARRERVKSTILQSPNYVDEKEGDDGGDNIEICSATPVTSERSRSAMTELSSRGNNLAAILRCQASRDKLEREIRAKMEEEHRERMMKLRSDLIGRKPAWRALRQAARQEHERDLDFRTCLRRDEAREQAERHRLEMEMMLRRVTDIPTLFERHSQSYQAVRQLQTRQSPKCVYKLKKKKRIAKRQNSSSLESDASPMSASRPDSGSLTSSSGARASASRSSKSSSSQKSERSTHKSDLSSANKKKSDRGTLRVSINETAELIEDRRTEKEGHALDNNDCIIHDGNS
ncbi:protein FAM161A isoform X2 [Venturia canescens]|uniref:protein FAM161A isoform X2 n=1 Tax=Venturia canescens TaxID=32260 RepID=UPI001C9C0BC9|nr:protein FAM161A isoform X2 [Venturia canescens]